MLKVRDIKLPLSFSWIGESRPFSRGVSGGVKKYPMALARDAYTPGWLAGQKQTVGKKKVKKATSKKSKKKVTKKKKRKQ